MTRPDRSGTLAGTNRSSIFCNYSGGGLAGRSPCKKPFFSPRLGGKAAQTGRKRNSAGACGPHTPSRHTPPDNYDFLMTRVTWPCSQQRPPTDQKARSPLIIRPFSASAIADILSAEAFVHQ